MAVKTLGDVITDRKNRYGKKKKKKVKRKK